MDILRTPFDPDFRLMDALDLRDFHRLIQHYSQLLGQINRKACNSREFESVHTEELFDWLCECGVPAENVFCRRNYILGNNQLEMGYWCVWLSAGCFIYSWDHKVMITCAPDVLGEELEYLCRLIDG